MAIVRFRQASVSFAFSDSCHETYAGIQHLPTFNSYYNAGLGDRA